MSYQEKVKSWNAFKKLCDRDEELSLVNSILIGYYQDLNSETEEMKEQSKKNNEKMQDEGASLEKLQI